MRDEEKKETSIAPLRSRRRFLSLAAWTAFAATAGFTLSYFRNVYGLKTRPELVKRAQLLMGTLVEITVRGPGNKNTLNAMTLAFEEIGRIENIMSTRNPDSEISRFNSQAGKDFQEVSPELLKLVREGIRFGDLSGGKLDIAIGPAVDLWNIDQGQENIPDPAQLARTLGLISYKDIQIQDNKVRLARVGMELNLNSLAKGYAIDRAIEILKNQGIQNAIVNIGGDLMAIGSPSDNRPWIVGVRHPRQPQNTSASFAVTNMAVATSGDYQRYFLRDKVRYHHILNPEDGMPARGIISSTTIAPSAMQAGVLATSAFLLGAEKGTTLIDSLPNMAAMTIGENGDKHFSKRFPDHAPGPMVKSS